MSRSSEQAPAGANDALNDAMSSPRMWVVAFLIGATALTLARPLLRFAPDPPPVVATMPAWSLALGDGELLDSEALRGTVYVMHRSGPECGATCRESMETFNALQRGLIDRASPVRLVTASPVGAATSAAQMHAWGYRHGAQPQRWHVGYLDEALVATTAGNAVTPQDLGWQGLAQRTHAVLVDQHGQVRGFYELNRADVVDELLHRTQHVLESTR